jgi:hypothetical protein
MLSYANGGGPSVNPWAIGSLALGLSSILSCAVPAPGILLGATAAVTAGAAFRQFRRDPRQRGVTAAICGMVCGCTGAATGVWTLIRV